jgi:osmotically inducible protein OsmC
MAVRYANAIWEGDFKDGKGRIRFGNFDGPFSYASRFEEGDGTNPEELLGAAHAGCYSMAFSNSRVKAGFTPRRMETKATVTLGKVDGRSRITNIHLDVQGDVPGVDRETFMRLAEETKVGCPVSAALTGVNITLDAKMTQSA